MTSLLGFLPLSPCWRLTEKSRLLLFPFFSKVSLKLSRLSSAETSGITATTLLNGLCLCCVPHSTDSPFLSNSVLCNTSLLFYTSSFLLTSNLRKIHTWRTYPCLYDIIIHKPLSAEKNLFFFPSGAEVLRLLDCCLSGFMLKKQIQSKLRHFSKFVLFKIKISNVMLNLTLCFWLN